MHELCRFCWGIRCSKVQVCDETIYFFIELIYRDKILLTVSGTVQVARPDSTGRRVILRKKFFAKTPCRGNDK